MWHSTREIALEGWIQEQKLKTGLPLLEQNPGITRLQRTHCFVSKDYYGTRRVLISTYTIIDCLKESVFFIFVALLHQKEEQTGGNKHRIGIRTHGENFHTGRTILFTYWGSWSGIGVKLLLLKARKMLWNFPGKYRRLGTDWAFLRTTDKCVKFLQLNK